MASSLPQWASNSFRSHSYENRGRNPFRIHTYRLAHKSIKTKAFKSFICHSYETPLRKPCRIKLLRIPRGVGGGVCGKLSLALLVLWTFLGLFCAPGAHAWGCRGHQTVAYLAEKHLTPAARQMVEQLFSQHPIDPQLKHWCGNSLSDALADAASWADDVRAERQNGPWHYIDIPRDIHRGSLEEFCGHDGCVTRAIAEQLAVLKDKSAGSAMRAEAARYVIHFVGDLHQPLHAVNNGDNGGNCVPVKFFRHAPLLGAHHPEGENYSPNLHQIWDIEIVERDMEISNPQRFADELDEKFRARIQSWEDAGIHVENWAWESHERAEQAVYGAFPKKIPIEPDVKPATCADNNHVGKRMFDLRLAVDDAYQRQAEKAVDESLAEAGIRLAMILNDAAK